MQPDRADYLWLLNIPAKQPRDGRAEERRHRAIRAQSVHPSKLHRGAAVREPCANVVGAAAARTRSRQPVTTQPLSITPLSITTEGDTIQADYGPYGSVSCYFA